MEKNKKDSQPSKIEIPKKVSIALRFLQFFQPQSLLGLILIALFLQTNFFLTHFFNFYYLRAAIYVLNIIFVVFLFHFLPSNFIEFLFPAIPVSTSLKSTKSLLKTESSTTQKKINKTEKSDDLSSISILFGDKDILKDQYFQELLKYVDLTQGVIKINSRLLDKITLLTISGWLSAFFAVLIIFRNFSLTFILHLFILVIFIISCFIGFRVINSIRSSI